MAKELKLTKGLNIKLVGQAAKIYERLETKGRYAVSPLDFHLLTPRLLVKEGDTVKAGNALFCDKHDERIRFASPVSGTVASVVRGERRRLERIVVETQAGKFEEMEFVNHPKKPAKQLERAEIVELLLGAGLWPYIRQRPYNIIAKPDVKPRAIFISAFDTAPLAPDIDFALKDNGEAFQAGIDALGKLTDGKVYLSVNAAYPANAAFEKATGVELWRVRGPHPAGNVGVQIHHIAPIAKGEVVWTVNPLDVIIIGRLFLHGIYDARKVIALCGSEVKQPRYYTVIGGTNLKPLLDLQVLPDAHARYISGNVLTGKKVPRDGFLSFYDTQVTVIPEGDHYEFMGWIAPGFRKFSASRLFPAFLLPGRTYNLDTNTHGGERAYVVSGQYEKVLPMDIYPVRLIKAMMSKNIELMEDLGAYEVAEEDFALCEVVCTSKIAVQSVVREGLNYMYSELN